MISVALVIVLILAAVTLLVLRRTQAAGSNTHLEVDLAHTTVSGVLQALITTACRLNEEGKTEPLWISTPTESIAFVWHPEAVKRCCSTAVDSKLVKGLEYQGAHSFLGPNGSLVSSGLQWKKMRKHSARSFNPKILRMIASTVMECCTRFVQNISSGDTIDIYEWATHLLMEASWPSIMGQPPSEEQLKVLYAGAVHGVNDISSRFNGKLGVEASNEIDSDAIQQLRAIVQGEIEAYAPENVDVSLLSTLMEARASDSSLTEDQIADELLTVLLVSHDGASAAIAWAVLLLLHNSEWKFRLAEETRRNPLPNVEQTQAHLRSLPVLNWVVKESLRLYAPAALYGRHVPNDELGCAIGVPKGTNFFVVPQVTHRLESIWKEASTYNPGRWEGVEAVPHSHYYPFGFGPRQCLGQSVAVLQIKATLFALFSATDIIKAHQDAGAIEPSFSPLPHVDSDFAGFILRPTTGTQVKIKQID